MSNHSTRVHHQGTKGNPFNAYRVQETEEVNKPTYSQHSCLQKQPQPSNQHSCHRRPTAQRARSIGSRRCRRAGTGRRPGGAGRTRRCTTSLGGHAARRSSQDTRGDRAGSDVRRSDNDAARSGSSSLRHRCAAISSRAGRALAGAEDRVGVVAAACAWVLALRVVKVRLAWLSSPCKSARDLQWSVGYPGQTVLHLSSSTLDESGGKALLQPQWSPLLRTAIL